jgi:hypothetical protein
MGTQKYLFGANQNSLYFHLQGEETPRLLKWSPFRSANEEVFCEVLCDRQFLAFFVFYTKDVYPKAPSDNKTIIKCFEELFLPFSAGSQDDPIQFQLPSLLTAHEVSAFYDPVLYRITECLSDTNKEVAYEAAQLLARYTQKGGRDYIRRIQECHLPVLERFVKKEELPLILAGDLS